MKIALVGNQNSGKSTLFNVLTGSNQKIGNWPGVTIEKKSGVIKNSEHTLIDLPGIYSLSPYSEEEKISRDYILKEKPDLIINIVDATSLERSLYLTTQLMDTDIPVVLVLNMVDLVAKKGIIIELEKLKNKLGVPVVEISALKHKGIDELLKIIDGDNKVNNLRLFDKDIESSIDRISNKLTTDNKRFYSIKVIENDELVNKIDIDEKYLDDMQDVIANQRYEYITKLLKSCVIYEEKKESITDKLDKVF